MAALVEAPDSALTFPLTMAAPHRRLRVADVQGAAAHTKRLADVGLVRGVQVLISSMGGWGILLQLEGCSRLAVDRRLAEQIWVEEP